MYTLLPFFEQIIEKEGPEGLKCRLCVAQQPHPDPNYAPHAAARLLAVA
jgi:hypothetical protein